MMQRTSLLLSATTKTAFNRNFSRMTTLPTASTISRASLLFNQQLQPQNLMTKCAFSGTQKCFSVAPELQEALRKEIKAEQEVEEDNLGGKTPPSIPGFKITRNEAEFYLTKMHGNEKISVLVNVNHSVDSEEADEMEIEGVDESGRSEEMQHDSVPVSLPPFRIEITKGDQRLIFYLQLHKSADGGYDYDIEEFMMAPAAKTTDKFEDVPEEVYSCSGKFIDPNLSELIFLKFLDERGFTAQFCHDLVKFATHYEHQQYVTLLEKLEKFVGGGK